MRQGPRRPAVRSHSPVPARRPKPPPSDDQTVPEVVVEVEKSDTDERESCEQNVEGESAAAVEASEDQTGGGEEYDNDEDFEEDTDEHGEEEEKSHSETSTDGRSSVIVAMSL